jgi:rare lipoprotein A
MIPLLSTIVLTASWYGDYFHGRIAADGSVYNMYASTAAHKSLPFGTRLRVCYKACEVVTITDRGPFIPGRHLDLSKGTATRIGMKDVGVAPVEVYRMN